MNRSTISMKSMALALGFCTLAAGMAFAEEEGGGGKPQGEPTGGKVTSSAAGKLGKNRLEPLFAVNGVATQGEGAELFVLTVLPAPREKHPEGSTAASESATGSAARARQFWGSLNVAGHGYTLRDIQIDREESSAAAATTTGKPPAPGKITGLRAVVAAFPDQRTDETLAAYKERLAALGEAPSVGSLIGRFVGKAPPVSFTTSKTVPFLDGTMTLSAGGAWRLMGRSQGKIEKKPAPPSLHGHHHAPGAKSGPASDAAAGSEEGGEAPAPSSPQDSF